MMLYFPTGTTVLFFSLLQTILTLLLSRDLDDEWQLQVKIG